MTIRYIINRFNQLKHDYIGETSALRTCCLWAGWLTDFLIYGASISDYFAYGFYKLRSRGKQEYITYRRFHYILRKAVMHGMLSGTALKLEMPDVFHYMIVRDDK